MKRKVTQLLLLAGVFVSGSHMAQTVSTGPSSSAPPYINPSVTNYSITSVLTVADAIASYSMCGIADGLGAYDNGNGTFTLLMNHEIGATVGATRAHGSIGGFVSKWIIDKNTLAVQSGADLIQNVYLWNSSSSTYSLYNSANTSTLANIGRMCSADLPEVTAFYNSATGKGTKERIFMNGEEVGENGRLFGHIATGPNAGSSYELPYLGKFSCENAIASPYRSDKTIVIGIDDASPGQVYVYIGNKSSSGNEITKAGLTGGTLYGVTVSGMMAETNTIALPANSAFSLTSLGSVQATTGTSINIMSGNLGITTFLRPEDGAWDPSNPRDFYFVTTNSFSSPSRMWRLRFNDINAPELGGTITMVLDGTEGQRMMDNLTIDYSGHVLITEDPGNQAYVARIWEYTIANDAFLSIAEHDLNLFTSTSPQFLTQDEESSGILDVQAILGPGKFICVDQAHYSIPSPIMEGGQLLVISSLNTATTNPEINVMGNSINIPAGNTTVSVNDNTDFGTTNIGSDVNKTFLIQNTGTGPLVISGINVTGTNAGDFVLVSPPSFPLNIAANGSQSITVKYGPVLAGASNATLNLYNNDYSEPIYDYALKGVAATIEIDVTGNGINIAAGSSITSLSNNTNFGNVYVTNSITNTFVIQNTGNGTLTVSGITIGGTNASEFTLINPPAFPLTMMGGATQTLSIQFQPIVIGSRSANVTVNNNDANESIYGFVIEGNSVDNVGIASQNKSVNNVRLFPNPTKDEAILAFNLESHEHVLVNVFDVAGKEVLVIEKDLNKGGQSMKINTSSLASGEYFVKISTNSKASTIKLVVVH